MANVIAFDMDGSIANLYNYPNWLERIRAYDPAPYAEANPMWDMAQLASILRDLQKQGWIISIVTWLSMESTPDYDKATRQAKKEWLNRYNFPYDHFHGVAYGTKKSNCIRRYADKGILIDDNAKVRASWTIGETIDPTTCDILDKLKKLLDNQPKCAIIQR